VKINPSNSELLRRAEAIGEYLSDCSTPLAMLFDRMPFLMTFLSPFLSMPALKVARNEWEKIVTEFRDTPFHDAKKLMVRHFKLRKMMEYLKNSRLMEWPNPRLWLSALKNLLL